MIVSTKSELSGIIAGTDAKVREATFDDQPVWDAFADAEGGNSIHYYGWKRVYEARGTRLIMLMIESGSRLIGIMPLVREEKRFYSIVRSDNEAGGLLLAQDLCNAERRQAITAVLSYIETKYAGRCSRFELRENLPHDIETSEEPTPVLIENGFRFRYDRTSRLPSFFRLELKQPFEEHIWKGLWSGKLRQELNKVERSGVTVIQDPQLKYLGNFIEMLAENYKRHGSTPKSEGEIRLILNTFKDRVKFFVALREGRPIVIMMCYYFGSTCFLAEIGSYTRGTEDADKLCYKAAIEDACNAGYRFADLSRAATAGLASFKERFKAKRIPIRRYEKRYSIPRTLAELVPTAFGRIRRDRAFIWKRRREFWDRIIHW